MIYCEKYCECNTFFLLSPDFETTFFFPPFSAMPLPQLLNFFFYSPISAMALPQLVCQIFFSFHFGHSTHTSHTRAAELGRGISISTLPKFNIFSPPFSSSLSYFWLNFSNSNTEIQSLSSKSQISFNSSYNAN